jgi:hypothetical protein
MQVGYPPYIPYNLTSFSTQTPHQVVMAELEVPETHVLAVASHVGFLQDRNDRNADADG